MTLKQWNLKFETKLKPEIFRGKNIRITFWWWRGRKVQIQNNGNGNYEDDHHQRGFNVVMKTTNQLMNMKQMKMRMNTDANLDVLAFSEGEDVSAENLRELHFLRPHNQWRWQPWQRIISAFEVSEVFAAFSINFMMLWLSHL